MEGTAFQFNSKIAYQIALKVQHTYRSQKDPFRIELFDMNLKARDFRINNFKSMQTTAIIKPNMSKLQYTTLVLV